MKKPICTILVASMLLGMASCAKEESKNSRKDKKTRKTHKVEAEDTTAEETTAGPIPETTFEETVPETIEETSKPTEETIEETEETIEETEETIAETVVETEPVIAKEHDCPVPVVNESVDNIMCNTVYLEYEGELRPYHLPNLMYSTEDAQIINKQINDLYNDIIEENEHSFFYYRADMLCYTFGDFITVALRISGDWDINIFYVWTINSKTGTRVSNSDILSVANNHPSSVVEAATNATINFTNKLYDQGDGVPFIKDGAINLDHVYGSWMPDDAYSWSINPDNIYEDMMIGIDSDGCIIYVSNIISLGGAGTYSHLFNEDGFDLNDFWPYEYSVD